MTIIIGFPSFNGSRVLFKSVCIPVYNITCTVLFVLVSNYILNAAKMFPVSKLSISISKNEQHHFVAQIDDFVKKGNQQKAYMSSNLWKQ